MGRSVDYLNNAIGVTYSSIDTDDEYSFEHLKEYWEYRLQELCPSLTPCKKWQGNEVQIFLENNLVDIGISEYCGLVSLSIAPKEFDGTNYGGIAQHWGEKVWPKIAELGEYFKVGNFSNGEGIYQKRKI